MPYDNITVKPHNYKGWITAKALKIREDFKGLGFDTLDAFITIATEASDEFSSYKDIKNLQNFWIGRYHSEIFNRKLEAAYDKLKAE